METLLREALRDPVVASGLALLLALGLLVAGAWLATRWRNAGQRARALAGAAGEREAEALLAREGWRVLQRQARARWEVRVDGRTVSVGLRADFLVERGGERLVAEVKTGHLAADLGHGPTRRQLLEYSLAFGVAEVLLVDVLAGSVQRVGFPAIAWDEEATA